MNYKIIIPEGKDLDSLVTELRYHVAATRAGGDDLLMIKIPDGDESRGKKTKSSVLRILRTMKNEGLIQFYAVKESFDSSSTESEFLINKYPIVFEDQKKIGHNDVYVKL